MQKKAALRTSEHWMNVNVIVLQMKIDFWIVGTVRHSTPFYSPSLPLFHSISQLNEISANFRGCEKGKKPKTFAVLILIQNLNPREREREIERDSNKYMNILSLKRTAAASNCVCGREREGGRECCLRSKLCYAFFMPRQRLRKTYGKARSPLDS